MHKASAYGGYGQRMLEKMGWETGQGLGANKDGMKQALEVKKKDDALGVGRAAAAGVAGGTNVAGAARRPVHAFAVLHVLHALCIVHRRSERMQRRGTGTGSTGRMHTTRR